MRLIKETTQSESQLAQKMAELVVYRAWRSGEEILNVYEHFFTVEEAVKSINIFTENMKKQEEEDLKKRGSKKENVKESSRNCQNSFFCYEEIQEGKDIADLFEKLANIK